MLSKAQVILVLFKTQVILVLSKTQIILGEHGIEAHAFSAFQINALPWSQLQLGELVLRQCGTIA